jgi:methyl-accepting chemotaxis protein
MKKIKLTFGIKIGLILTLVATFPLLLGTLFIYSISSQFLKETTLSNLKEITEVVTSQVEDFISTSFDNIEVLTKNPILSSLTVSWEEKSEELNKIIKYYPKFQDITFVDENGRTLSSTSFKFYGRWRTNPWFAKAKEKKKVVMSEIYAVLNPKEPILAFFAPVFNEKGEPLFFMAVQINMEKFLEIFDSVKIGQRGYAFLINSKGDILSHPKRDLLFEKISPDYPLRESFEKEEGSVEFNFEKVTFVGSFRNVKIFQSQENESPKWQVVVVQPKKEAFALLDSLKIQIFVLLFLSLFLIILFSFFLSKQTTRPLRELVLATEKISKGQFETPIQIERSDEFGELARSFNEMAKKLQSFYLELEESKKVLEIKVQARTRELKEVIERQEEIIRERTRELQERIEELEKFHKLAVGRELKMIELKKEIERLKGELEKYKKEEQSY